MGYDCTMHIVKKSDVRYAGETGRYAEIIGTFELCKMGYFTEYHKLFTSENAKISGCYIYIGEEETTLDKYGKPLAEASIADTIAALEKDNAKEPYRRITPVLAYLKAFDLTEWTDGEIAVLHYGH